jgi:hypothetical protein
MTSQPTTAMTSAKFSEFVLSIDDLYNMGIRNGFYLPKQSSSAVNELMLTNVLKKCSRYGLSLMIINGYNADEILG